MKIIIYALLLLFCFATAFSQNIFIANNNPGAAGGTRVFTGQYAIENAVAAASDGDIIYVVPSNVTYFPVNLVGKSVSLIGGGFNPDKPGGPPRPDLFRRSARPAQRHLSQPLVVRQQQARGQRRATVPLTTPRH